MKTTFIAIKGELEPNIHNTSYFEYSKVGKATQHSQARQRSLHKVRLSLLGLSRMKLDLKPQKDQSKSSKLVDDTRDGDLTKALTPMLLKNTILIFLH